MSESTGSEETVIDDFEDGTLSEYDHTSFGTDLRTDLTYEGTYALELPARRGSTADSQCVSVSGDIPYPSRGDSFGGYLYQPDSANQFRYVFAAQNASKDPNGYNVAISGDRDFVIEIDRRGTELARTSLADVDHTGKWLEVVIDWEYDDATDTTTITAALNDKGPDGTENNGQLVQIQGSESPSSYASGGIAFNADAKGPAMAFDNARIFSSGEPVAVSASVSTIQFIPGKEENPSRDGHPLNSALMQIIPGEGKEVTIPFIDRTVSIGPVFDNWIGADMKEDIAEDLEEARKPKNNKYVDDRPGEEFNEYRFENGVNVAFETTDEVSVDDDTVEITFSEAGPSGDDPRIQRGEEEPSKTVLHDNEINSLPWEEWYGENVRDSRRQPRYYNYETDFEFDGVEGVRVFTVWGGWAGFMRDFSSRIADNPASFFSSVWNWPVPTSLAKLVLLAAPPGVGFITESLGVVPNTFTVLDVVVLADGRRYVRVWDASQYPSLATYVDGKLKSLEQMPYEPHQEFNAGMTAFFLRAISGFTPYESLALRQYKGFIRQKPWAEGELEDDLIRLIDKFDLPYTANELMPTVPRDTLGFDGNARESDELANPDEPFSEGVLLVPWAGLPYDNEEED